MSIKVEVEWIERTKRYKVIEVDSIEQLSNYKPILREGKEDWVNIEDNSIFLKQLKEAQQ